MLAGCRLFLPVTVRMLELVVWGFLPCMGRHLPVPQRPASHRQHRGKLCSFPAYLSWALAGSSPPDVWAIEYGSELSSAVSLSVTSLAFLGLQLKDTVRITGLLSLHCGVTQYLTINT